MRVAGHPDDAAAKAWLSGPGANSVLEPGDRWQAK